MKVRTQQNFNRKTYETVFGISIMPDGGRRYCKYPIGHQEYKDHTPDMFEPEGGYACMSLFHGLCE